MFYTKDETGLCAAFTSASGSTDAISRLLDAVSRHNIVLFRIGNCEVTPGYEAILQSMPPGPTLIVKCKEGNTEQRFYIGYQTGIVFGFVTAW